jgi:hypothetical protein
MLLPHALVPISEVWTKDRPEADAGGSWVAKRENVERLLVTIIRRARRPMRHAKKIRAAARLTYAKFIALTYEWQTRRRPIEQEEPDRPCARLEEDPQHARGHLRRADRDSDQAEANSGSATSTKSLIVPSPAPGGVYLSRMVSSA